MPGVFYLNVALIVPTYQAGKMWEQWLHMLSMQSLKPNQIVMIDSSSTDDTVINAKKYGLSPIIISPADFNHGGTRNRAVNTLMPCDVVVFLTQDSLFDTSFSLEKIVSVFDDEKVSSVCGRQLPHYDANPLALHARFFNYPAISYIKTIDDIPAVGIKVAFMSNSFAAYRYDTFKMLGGFPENTILAEDMYMAAKMILAGYKVAYCAEATVRHSHNYTPWEEFRRYFDTGVFHACEPWIQERLGGASGEGLRFVKSELRYLWHHAPLWIPRALLTTACKLLGYKLGKNYKKLPKSWRPKLSMYKSYWLQQDN